MEDGSWQAIMAERLPQELDDVIKGHHADFYKAMSGLTPEQLLDTIPMSFPMTYLVEGFPCIARYPVDEWIDNGEPYLSTVGWCKLCMKVADRDLTTLHTVFTTADTLMDKLIKEEEAREHSKF